MTADDYRTHKCPHGCGWTRAYRVDRDWQEQVIDHPVYGRIKNDDLVRTEIGNHDCEQYTAALMRLQQAKERKAA